ncbi:double-headed protease inhibitor, submandibular gland-like isoform X1 [Equus asinus]|nr:PREDICTED: double-headed protease inhibitor, submandibular gland-like isoform X1 [Equus przewalskii]XP_023473242.1 double-headed protease inhibitor, submandibular gland isoform X1 [Equus caballus]XP_044600001.1 double-headed protease inhibitor, submandibular gland-like [Equus asinus]XP_046521480.1 double-headed protease inhibitor, submandibular gland-like isoform X1 [Equus quagga]
MKKITAFAILALAATTWAASPPAVGTEVDCSKYNRRSSRIICTREWEPICGIDGKTYGNECIFCLLNRNKGIPLRKLYDDKCIDCLEYSDACSKDYLPLCGSDGINYANKCLFCNAVVMSRGALFLTNYGPC